MLTYADVCWGWALADVDEQGFVVEELAVSEVLLEYPGDLVEVLAVRMRDR